MVTKPEYIVNNIVDVIRNIIDENISYIDPTVDNPINVLDNYRRIKISKDLDVVKRLLNVLDDSDRDE